MRQSDLASGGRTRLASGLAAFAAIWLTTVPVHAQRVITSPNLSAFTAPTLGAISVDTTTGWIYASGFESRALGLARDGFARVTLDGVVDAAWKIPRMHQVFSHVVAEDGALYVHGMLSANGPRLIARFDPQSPEPTNLYSAEIPVLSQPYDGIGRLHTAEGGRYVYFSGVQSGSSVDPTIRRIDTRTRAVDAVWSHRPDIDYAGVVASRPGNSVLTTAVDSKATYAAAIVKRLDDLTGAARWTRRFERVTVDAAAVDEQNRSYLLLRSEVAPHGATLLRLDADGNDDPTWNGVLSSQAASLHAANRLLLTYADSVVLAVAEGPAGDDVRTVGLRRYGADGRELARWSVYEGMPVTQLQRGRDGKFFAIAGGKLQTHDLASLQPTQAVALSFGAIGTVTQIINLPDGGRLFAGSFDTWYDGQRFRALLRTRSDGTPVRAWRYQFDTPTPSLNATLTSRGVLLSGSFKRINGKDRNGLALIADNGDVDEWNWSPPLPSNGVVYDDRGEYLYFADWPAGTSGSRVRRASLVEQRIDPDWQITLESSPDFTAFGPLKVDPSGGLWVVAGPESTFGGQPWTELLIRRYDITRKQLTFSTRQTVGAYYYRNVSATAQHLYLGDRRYALAGGGQLDPGWQVDPDKYHFLGHQRIVGKYLYFSGYPDGNAAVHRSLIAGTGAVDTTWVARNADIAECGGSQAALLADSSAATGDDAEFLLRCQDFRADPRTPFIAGSMQLVSSKRDPSPDVEVVEYLNTDVGRYFMTGRANEQQELDARPASFRRTGMRFSARGAIFVNGNEDAICRFYAPPALGASNTHFYGSRDDCAALNTVSRFLFEGYDFTVLKPVDGSCPATAPNAVTRLYNNKAASNESNHRYVVSAATKARMLAQGWIDEGPVFCTVSAADANAL